MNIEKQPDPRLSVAAAGLLAGVGARASVAPSSGQLRHTESARQPRSHLRHRMSLGVGQGRGRGSGARRFDFTESRKFEAFVQEFERNSLRFENVQCSVLGGIVHCVHNYIP